MDRQLPQTALPYRLSGEHFRHHYRALCPQRPRADVDGSVGICVRGVAARDAAKGGLIGAVLLVDAAARSALARRVAGINEDHGDASTLCLVGDESAQLSETPISQPCALIAAGRYPLANPLEFFKGDPPRGAFSIHHDSLGDAVVRMFLEPRLFPGHLAKSALGTFCATLLQPVPAFLLAATDTLNVRASIGLAIAISGKLDNAKINAKPILCVELVCFGDVAGGCEYPLSTDKAQINLSLAESHQPLLVIAHHDWNDHAAFERPQTDRASVFDEADYPIVVGLSSIGPKDRSHILIDLEGVSHFGDGSHDGLCRQAESTANLCIGQLVEIVLPEGLALEAAFSKPRTCGIASFKRRHQAHGLLRRRQHLDGSYELHAIKYGAIRMQSQERRAIPPPASAGGFSRSPL